MLAEPAVATRLSAVGDGLRKAGFGLFLDAVRAAEYDRYTAWLDRPLPPPLRTMPLGSLFGLLHHGVPQAGTLRTSFARLMAQLEDADFIEPGAGEVRPGAWLLTQYRDILAVCDRPADEGTDDSRVYVGEDSLRFVDWIGAHEPVERALDLGCGSGISTAALARAARHTLAVDIDDLCCAATRRTVALNGPGAGVDVAQADIREARGLARHRRFDLVVSNPPDVPVPEGLAYSTAGHGGEDGLRFVRAVLEGAPALLSPMGTVRMHFHALGDAGAPHLARVLERFGRRRGWSSILLCHSRLPVEVRSAITARWAGPHNPGTSAAELLRRCDEHARKMRATHFYGCTLVSRAGGDGTLTWLSLHGDRPLDSTCPPSRKGGGRDADAPSLLASYAGRVRALPDGLRELAVDDYLAEPARRLDTLRERFAAGQTIREATEATFTGEFARDPVNARALYVLVMKLRDALTEAGAVADSAVAA